MATLFRTMRWSLNIGRLVGIPIKVHFSLLVLLAVLAVFYGGKGDPVTSLLAIVVMAAVVFGSILLHELGHALVARRYGVATREILLLPIGGAAMLEDAPTTPRQDFLIAAAGPAVSLLLAGIAYGLSELSSGNLLIQFASLNLLLGLGNLIPAFPLDGGRMLRASLTHWMGRVRATRMAAVLGRFFAVALVVTAFWEGAPMLGVIGAFIYVTATSEERTVIFRDIIGSRSVRDVMMPVRRIFGVTEGLEAVGDALANDSGARAFPVVFGAKLLGVLYREPVLAALELADRPLALRDLLDRNVAVTHADQPLLDLLAQMGSKQARTAIVLAQGADGPDLESEPQGVVLIDNVIEAIQREGKAEF